MDELNYHIYDQNDKLIGSFMNDGDRDICMDALAETYPDCEFIPQDI